MTNSITIQGRLSGDPALRFTPAGDAVCNFSIPDQKRKFNKETQEWENASDTTWFRVALWKREAEEFAEKARKGTMVVVTGRLVTKAYTRQDGTEGTNLEIDYPKCGIVVGAEPGQQGGQQPQQPPNQQGWGQPPQGQQQPQGWGQPPQQGQQGWGAPPQEQGGGWNQPPADDRPPF